MNARLTRWLLELIADGKRIRAIVPMDFYRQEGWAGELLVFMNFLESEDRLTSVPVEKRSAAARTSRS